MDEDETVREPTPLFVRIRTGSLSQERVNELSALRADDWVDGVCALAAVTAMKSCIEGVKLLSEDLPPFAKATVFTGVIVNYFRAFEEVKHPARQLVRRFKVKGIESADFRSDLHQALLTARNAQVAHAGHLPNDIAISFMRGKLNGHEPDAEPREAKTLHRLIFGTHARASVAIGVEAGLEMQLLAHIEALHNLALDRLKDAIAGHQQLTLVLLANDPDYSGDTASLMFNAPVENSDGKVSLSGGIVHVSKASSPKALPLDFHTIMYAAVPHADEFVLEVMEGRARRIADSLGKDPI